MGRYPQMALSCIDVFQVGALQVLLTQVHTVGAVLKGELPVVVDEEFRGRPFGRLDGLFDFALQGLGVL